MNVVIVNCFETNEPRVKLVREYFVNKGNEVTIIQSDFMHISKMKRLDKEDGFIFVESLPYYKNISIDRIKSHYKFAKDAFRIVEEIKPDVLYVIVPANSLVKFAKLYKMKNKNVRLYFDVMDLWPETMPIGSIKKLPPFTFWKAMRDKNIRIADFIITECNLYQKVMDKTLEGCNVETIYLARLEDKIQINPQINTNEVNLSYLGSINNIIDIEKIKTIINLINKIKPTTLHIIGDGEKRQLLIDEVSSTGAKVEYHGKIYDPIEKQKIFDKCQFGLNIMKDSVCVGLTMKSIDYFQHGVPIINNIQEDTANLVNKYKIGINITNFNINEVANKIADYNKEEIIQMKNNTHKVFNQLFSYEAFIEKLDEVMEA